MSTTAIYALIGFATLAFVGALLLLVGVGAYRALSRPKPVKRAAPAPPPLVQYSEPIADPARQAIELLRQVEIEETARRYRQGAGRRGLSDMAGTVDAANTPEIQVAVTTAPTPKEAP